MPDPTSWLQGTPTDDTVLIILNQEITRPDVFDLAWKASVLHVVSDGAANRLRSLGNKKYVPDMIVGDFDSITPESREFYEDLDVTFIEEEDQNANDLMKSMKFSHKKLGEKSIRFLAFGALGGRVDHSWYSYLSLSISRQNGDNLVLISDQNITIALGAGEHWIDAPASKVGRICGYAPLEGESLVDTKGFKWDVNDFELSFTKRLSTSNSLVLDRVWIKTTKLIMFTVQLLDSY